MNIEITDTVMRMVKIIVTHPRNKLPIPVVTYFCLVGEEAEKVEKLFDDLEQWGWIHWPVCVEMERAA